MYGKLKDFLTQELANIKAAGLYKNERIITTPQRADIKVNAGSDVLNFCANNYLGLSDNQRLIKAAKEAMDTHGYGMSSVRFICGTQDLHKQLEAAISDYFKTEDTILYAACFDANGGLFEPLFTEEDAINLRCFKPCLHYRRRTSLQGKTLPLCQCRHGRPGTLPARSPGTTSPHHRNRRCVLYGRKRGPDGQNLRTGRKIRRIGNG